MHIILDKAATVVITGLVVAMIITMGVSYYYMDSHPFPAAIGFLISVFIGGLISALCNAMEGLAKELADEHLKTVDRIGYFFGMSFPLSKQYEIAAKLKSMTTEEAAQYAGAITRTNAPSEQFSAGWPPPNLEEVQGAVNVEQYANCAYMALYSHPAHREKCALLFEKIKTLEFRFKPIEQEPCE